MSVEQNKKTALAFFQALGKGDRKALHALCDDGLEWTVPQGAILHAGTHSPANSVFDLMLSAVSDTFVAGSQRTDFDLIIGEGNVVMAEARVHADGTNGRDYDNVYVFVFEFTDESDGARITKLREHVDTRYAAGFFG
jgi:ketosteroid isomerase-like protein